MTQIFLKLTAPAGRTSEILKTLDAIRLPAELDRDCARTHLGVEWQEPDVMVYLEEWLTEEALRRRVGSLDFRGMLCVLEMAVEQPLLEFREFTVARGLDYVAAVRSHGETPFGGATTGGPAGSRGDR